jgi:D-galactonate transporter
MKSAAMAAGQAVIEGSGIYRKVIWRIMPLVVFCYVGAYLDRVNVGFAKLRMLSDLGFSDEIYGLGAGIFFIGYFLFEVPSNLILHRVGARRWIARIMITWAVISAATLFVKTPTQFYAARFLLGLAEAGFSPGIMLYLTYWFPARLRASALGIYYISIPLAGVVGGPLSGWILQHFAHSTVMKDWQWLFVLEAIPSLVAGIVTFLWMDDSPQHARWLSQREKSEITETLARENVEKASHPSVRMLFKDGRIWQLSGIYFLTIIGLYGITFWLPSILKNSGLTDVGLIGWLSAIPYLVSIFAIIATGATADKTRARRLHFAAAMALGAIGLAMSGYVGHSPLAAVFWLSVATAGMLSGLSLFWGVPSSFLAGVSAAAGIATINSLGNLAGFVTNYFVGWINVVTGQPAVALYVVASCMFIAGLLIYTIPKHAADR